jgi:N-dimethylarginine dimethylaminohydrolase
MLVSDTRFFALDAPINPYYNDGQLDSERAQVDHANIVRDFREAGIQIVHADSPEGSQDGVYTANWALVHDGKAVLARLPQARKAEEPVAEAVLRDLGLDVVRVPGTAKFSGQGDSLICGEYLLAGSGYRSDPIAQQFAAEYLGLKLVQLHAVPILDAAGKPKINAASGWPDSLFYDIDLAISVLRPDLIAYCPAAFDEESQKAIEALPMDRIQVSFQEATTGFACNLVSTGDTVVMSAKAPELQAAIESHGLKTLTPEVHELTKGGGFIRCVSLTLD